MASSNSGRVSHSGLAVLTAISSASLSRTGIDSAICTRIVRSADSSVKVRQLSPSAPNVA